MELCSFCRIQNAFVLLKQLFLIKCSKRNSRRFRKITTKWYDLQKNIKNCKKCEKKEIENEIDIIFSCDKFDDIRRKAFNGTNKVDDIN